MLDEWNGGTHPLLYKLGVVEVETTLVVLTNIGESAFSYCFSGFLHLLVDSIRRFLQLFNIRRGPRE